MFKQEAKPMAAAEEIRVYRKKRNNVIKTESDEQECITKELVVVDPMVDVELDAARALADFAQLALLASSNSNNTDSVMVTADESSRTWGNKKNRSVSHRVKNEFSPKWRSNIAAAESKSPDLVQDSVEDNILHKKARRSVTTRPKKIELNLDSPVPTPQCSTSYISSGECRPRSKLTEAEKETKRIRRILANRESARQTIRRRQAMCEELTRKAADLALENKNIKREKILVVKEYLLLKEQNQHLKSLIARSAKGGKEEVSSAPVSAVPPSSEKQQSFVVFSTAGCTPFVWSPSTQPLNSSKTQPLQSDSVVASCKLESSDEQGILQSANGCSPSFYIVPCPWFFSQGNGLYPHPLDSFGLRNKQEASSVANPCDQASSMRVTENLENSQPSSSRECVTDTKSPISLPDTTIRLAPSEENHSIASHPCVLSSMSISLQPIEALVPINCESRVPQDSTSLEESGSSVSNYSTTFPDSVKAQFICHSQKMMDAAAAAEARKRRKELTKLKNLNGRQLRLQY